MPRCPNCTTPLTRVDVEDDLHQETCSSCFGTWISRGMLARVTRRPAAAGQTAALEDLVSTVAESDSKLNLRCPDCHTGLTKKRFHPMIPVNVDVCGTCQGVWLDVGELPLLRALYQEMQTSTDPAVVALREKIQSTQEQIAVDRIQIEQQAERARALRDDITWAGRGYHYGDDDLATDALGTFVRLFLRGR